MIDERATDAQRGALLRIISGQDTEPGTTVFNVFAATLEKLHDPIFAPIDFPVDVAGRRARLVVPGITEGRGEPILNPVTGLPHRVRIDIVDGFEYSLAEIGRGWTKTAQPIEIALADSYANLLKSTSAKLHPDPSMEGQNEIDLKDVNGKPIIRGLRSARDVAESLRQCTKVQQFRQPLWLLASGDFVSRPEPASDFSELSRDDPPRLHFHP